MGFLSKLFGGPSAPKDDGIYLYARCGNCGRTLKVRINRQNDLLPDWDSGGYSLSKEMMDDKCFRLMRAELTFDARYNITSQSIEGGEFITREVYEASRQPHPSIPPE